MIKRPFRSLKVPLVFGGQWKDHQTFQKWDPISKRLITVNCCLPRKPNSCARPSPVNSVSLVPLTGVITWNYSGPDIIFEIIVYESATLPVVPTGTVVFSTEGTLTSPYTSTLTPILDYYYFVSVRVKSVCGYSDYAYSPVQQYTCPIPLNPTNVVLSNLTEYGADVSWNYVGTPPSFEVNVYQSATSPVNTSSSPIFSQTGSLTSPSSGSFTPIVGYYYVASVRAYDVCGYSEYVYSSELQFSYRFVRVNTGVGSDPGRENFSVNIVGPNYTLNFSKTALNLLDASNYLNSIATNPPPTTIVLRKSIFDYVTLRVSTADNMGTHWKFTCLVLGGAGDVIFVGDTASLTYS